MRVASPADPRRQGLLYVSVCVLCQLGNGNSGECGVDTGRELVTVVNAEWTLTGKW